MLWKVASNLTLSIHLESLHTLNPPLSKRVEQRHERIAIVQYTGSVESEAKGYACARLVMKAYAEKHSYAYYLFQERDVMVEVADEQALKTFRKHHNWRRPFLLSQVIREQDHEWIAYFDTDVVITDPTITLESFIDVRASDADMIVADDPSGINNGVFFQKATNWSLLFNLMWWNERPSRTREMGDNWPFMAALLRAWASSSGKEYAGECSISKHVEMESWNNFFPCYRRQIETLGSITTHPAGCTFDFPEPCGSALADDQHIKAVWGINSGIGFGGKNAWNADSFLLHLAGKPPDQRDELLRYHSESVIAKYFDDLLLTFHAQ